MLWRELLLVGEKFAIQSSLGKASQLLETLRLAIYTDRLKV